MKKNIIASTLIILFLQLPVFAADEEKKDHPLLKKLEQIIIPEIQFEETPFNQAIEFIRHKSLELDHVEADPQKKGANFVITPGAQDAKLVSLHLSNAPMSDVIHYLCDVSGVGCRLEENAILIVAADRGIEIPRSEPDDYISEKLKGIIIPAIEFQDTPLSDASEFLRIKGIELDRIEADPAKKGVNILIGPGVKGDTRLTLTLSNISLHDAIRYTAELSRAKLRIDGSAVVIVAPTDEH